MRAVLCFHSVDETGSVISIRPEELSSLVDAIQRSGHAILSLSELLDSAPGDDAVALTFDDGFASNATIAASLLSGLSPTLFLTTGTVGKSNAWPGQSPIVPILPMATWTQVEALAAAGWHIESHSHTHPDLTQLSDDDVRDELVRSCDLIEARVARRPRFFAYPYGHHDLRVEALAGQLFEAAFSTEMACLPEAGLVRERVPRLETYYLRSSAIHRWFGRRRFDVYLKARAGVRRARALDLTTIARLR